MGSQLHHPPGLHYRPRRLQRRKDPPGRPQRGDMVLQSGMLGKRAITQSVVDGANLLSQKIVNNERHWNESKDRWLLDLGHTIDIVDYCVELKKKTLKEV